MLAYYSSLVKKEELMPRISEDADQLAVIANDLVCDVKSLAVTCRNKNIEDSLQTAEHIQELIRVVNAMANNLKSNLEAYAQSLVPAEKPVQQVEHKEQEVLTEEQKQTADPNQLSGLLDAVRTLKELKDSISQ